MGRRCKRADLGFPGGPPPWSSRDIFPALDPFPRRCSLRSHKGASTRGVEWRGAERAPAAHLTARGRGGAGPPCACNRARLILFARPLPGAPVSSVRILRRRLHPARNFAACPRPGGRHAQGCAGARCDDAGGNRASQPRPVKRAAARSSPRRSAQRRLPHTDRFAPPKLELPPIVVPAFVSSPLRPRSEPVRGALALALAALPSGSGAGLSARASGKR